VRRTVVVLAVLGATRARASPLSSRNIRCCSVWTSHAVVAVGEHTAQAGEPPARQAAARAEVAFEVLVAIERPDDARDRDRAHAEVGPTRDPQSTPGLVERQQVHV